MVEQTIEERAEGKQSKPLEDMTLDELDEMEDEEDDRILQQYRYKRFIETETQNLITCNLYGVITLSVFAGNRGWQRFWPTSRRLSLVA